MPTADSPAAARSAAGGAGAWAVQVGAFGQEANATQLSDRLKGAGFPAYVERRGESFAVRVGPYVRRTDADLADYFAEPYRSAVAVPTDATDTGYARDGRHLWLSKDERAAFVGGQRVFPDGSGSKVRVSDDLFPN